MNRSDVVKTRTYLDWVYLTDYISQHKLKGFNRDKFMEWARDGGGFCNGCFVTLEPEFDSEDEDYPPDVRWLTELVFREFPEAVGEFGGIDIWVWW